jgi:hypothetical protein
MISVRGRTYRIVPVGSGVYDAIRLLDDTRIGSFGGGSSPVGDDGLLRQIAETALRSAKTHWTPRPSR